MPSVELVRGVACDLPRGRGIVAAVEPDLAVADQRPGRKMLKPRRPVGAAHRRVESRRGNMKRVLMTQHCDRERGIHRLMLAGQPRQRQGELALFVVIAQPPVGDDRVPERRRAAAIARPASCATSPMRAGDGGRVELRDERDAGLGDGGLFARDIGQAGRRGIADGRARGWRFRVTSGRSITLVASSRPPRPTSRMHASAGVRAKARMRGGGRDFEEARLDALAGVEHLGEQLRQRFIVDQAPGDPDPLVEPDQMRAGEGVDLVPARFQRGAQEGDRRALAVGARRRGGPAAACPGDAQADRAPRRSVRGRAGRRPAKASTAGRAAPGRPDAPSARSPPSMRPLWPPARDRRSSSASFSFSSPRETTMSIMPCSSRYSARWKPSGSFSRIVCSITRWPAKPISAPGSASWTSPSIA